MKRGRAPEHLAAFQIDREDVAEVVDMKRVIRRSSRPARRALKVLDSHWVSSGGVMPASTDSANRICQAGSTVSARRGPASGADDEAGFPARRPLVRRSGTGEAARPASAVWPPERDLLVVVAIGQFRLDLLEFGLSPRAEECQRRLHRQQAGGDKSVSGCSRKTASQQSAARSNRPSS